MFNTIYCDFDNDKDFDENQMPKSADSYHILCLKKLENIIFIKIDQLNNINFKCKNILISKYKNLLKFNKFVIENKKLELIKKINIYVFKMASIHNKFINLEYNYNVISTYSYALNLYYNNYTNNFWIPHIIRYQVEYNKNPINKLLVSGSCTSKRDKSNGILMYPNRDIMIEKSKLNINIDYLKRPYLKDKNDINDNHFFGKKYIKLLSNYRVCFTDDANKNRPYIVAKFFEIMSSGALLLTTNKNTKKYFKNLGFYDEIDYISTTIDKIDEKIEFILDEKNKKLIDKIRKSGYDKVYKYNYVDKIINKFDEIFSGKLDNFTLYNDGINGTKYFLYNSKKI